MTVEDLPLKSRKELQALAKSNGVKANMSTKNIVFALQNLVRNHKENMSQQPPAAAEEEEEEEAATIPLAYVPSFSLPPPPVATSPFLPPAPEAPSTPPSPIIGTMSTTDPAQADMSAFVASYVPACTQCGTTDYDDLPHCDFCEAEVCSRCDSLKQMCGIEGVSDLCGRVRCGACTLAQQMKWECCSTCGVVVCTDCSERGHEIFLDKGVGLDTVCCHICADMAHLHMEHSE